MMGSTSTSTLATSYASPSSTYVVNVVGDPPYGATYLYSKQGVELWSGEKPYTLREIVVTDQGLVTGFAYRVGPKRDQPKRKHRRVRKGGPASPVNPPQYLHIVILGADGSEILNDVIERGHPGFPSTPPPRLIPYVGQFLVDSANDRIIVRLLGGGEQWRVYRLSTGELMDMFHPMERAWNTKDPGFFVELEPVAGTPLVLAHWCLRGPDYRVKGYSARFALLDTEFKPVWSFDAANDYARLGFHRSFNRVPVSSGEFFRNHPAIEALDPPGQFQIRLFAKNEEISFSVTRTNGLGYDVTELGRVGIDIKEQVCTDHSQSDP